MDVTPYNTALLTEAQTDLTSNLPAMVGGGPTSQRPGNPPQFFRYFDTDLQKTVTWTGFVWFVPASGTQGPQGPAGGTGATGPQGAQGAPFGSVYWNDIVGKPSTFDILSLGSNWIRYNIGLQFTWYIGASLSGEGQTFAGYPVTVSSPLCAISSAYLPTVSTADDWLVQILNVGGSGIQWAAQRVNTSSHPVAPSFVVVSNNTSGSP